MNIKLLNLRVAILLDSWNVRNWQATIIDFIVAHALCEIVAVVLNKSEALATSSGSKRIYSLLRRIDRKLFPVQHDCFTITNVEKLLGHYPVVQAKPISRRYTDSFTEESLSELRKQKPDIIVRFGFRILKGNILNIARFGVWSLHHGDTAINRGGPPGFWEVVNGDAVTGVTLQILTEELDGGKVLDKSFIRTNRTSFNRNQNTLFWAGVELFCRNIDRQARNGLSYPAIKEESGFYSERLYRDPHNYDSLKILIRFAFRRILEFRLWNAKQWKLYVKFGSAGSASLFKFRPLEQPRNFDWADPFVIQKNGEYYLFFEELRVGTDRGHISLHRFAMDGRQLTNQPVQVLKEDFHLSYPFVFEHHQNFYMTPECGNDHKVWLYRSHNFPFDWRRERLLIDKELYDPTLIEQNGVWYLFATERPYPGCLTDQYLVIYYATNLLLGTWERHPKSPMVRDVRCARSAGRIFQLDGKLVRPAQIGAPSYGYGVALMEIAVLSVNEYEEVFLDSILPNWQSEIRAVHTYNQNAGMTAVDAQVHL